MKVFIFLLFACLGNYCAFCQKTLTIKEIIVYNLYADYATTKEGPSISLTCVLANTGSNDMVIHPSKSDISVRFSLDKNKFSVDAVDLKFSEIENLILMKNQTTEFTVNISPLIVTQILSKKNISYSEIMLRLLPTIQVIYAEPMPNTRVASEKIENVIVKK